METFINFLEWVCVELVLGAYRPPCKDSGERVQIGKFGLEVLPLHIKSIRKYMSSMT